MTSSDAMVYDLLQRTYEPTRSLAENVSTIARQAASTGEARALRIEMPELGSLTVGKSSDRVVWQPLADAPPGPDNDAAVRRTLAPSSLADPSARCYPLRVGEETWGQLVVAGPVARTAEPMFAALAAACILLLRRERVRRWSVEHLGHDFALTGFSGALQALERAIDPASRSRLPTLISGEFGTEVLTVAISLHCAGPHSSGPFVEVHCPSVADLDIQAALPQWFARAAGGSLLFSGIEALSTSAQAQLLKALPSPLGQRVGPRAGPMPRILASTAADVRQLADQGRLLRELVGELGVIELEVPPLRLRIDDLELHAARILERHGYSLHHKGSESLFEALAVHAWPDNLFELERVLLRLAVMTGDARITREDVLRHTPWVLAAEATGETTGDPAGDPDPDPAAPARARPVDWLRVVVDRDVAKLETLHEGLRRALLYMIDNYQEPLALGQLARQAHVSPSHLSYLFKQFIGASFKTLLVRLRIEKAKGLLASNGHQRITEIAATAGFSDLSHFEKTFRRYVDASPREFRNRIVAPA